MEWRGSNSSQGISDMNKICLEKEEKIKQMECRVVEVEGKGAKHKQRSEVNLQDFHHVGPRDLTAGSPWQQVPLTTKPAPEVTLTVQLGAEIEHVIRNRPCAK